MEGTSDIINEALKRLKDLTGEDFHGYRSEVWNVIHLAMKKQDRNTRHLCAENVLKISQEAHDICMNLTAI